MSFSDNQLILVSTLAFLIILSLCFRRSRSVIFLLPAWFSPHKKLRVIFHRLRGVKIGKNVEIGFFVYIDNSYPNLVEIRDNVTITMNCIILAHDNSHKYTGRSKESRVSKVIFEESCFVGAGSLVLPGVTIGSRSIVAAGSVVTKNVGSDCIVKGNPANK